MNKINIKIAAFELEKAIEDWAKYAEAFFRGIREKDDFGYLKHFELLQEKFKTELELSHSEFPELCVSSVIYDAIAKRFIDVYKLKLMERNPLPFGYPQPWHEEMMNRFEKKERKRKFKTRLVKIKEFFIKKELT